MPYSVIWTGPGKADRADHFTGVKVTDRPHGKGRWAADAIAEVMAANPEAQALGATLHVAGACFGTWEVHGFTA